MIVDALRYTPHPVVFPCETPDWIAKLRPSARFSPIFIVISISRASKANFRRMSNLLSMACEYALEVSRSILISFCSFVIYSTDKIGIFRFKQPRPGI